MGWVTAPLPRADLAYVLSRSFGVPRIARLEPLPPAADVQLLNIGTSV